MARKGLYDIRVIKKATTPAAWLLSDGVTEDWFPKSQCELEELGPGDYELTAPEWLLKEKGFI
jgi:hypothetical protein